MGKIVYENSLTLVVLFLFAGSFVGQVLTGQRVYDEELRRLGGPGIELGAYLSSGHFLEATFENWESEFLQMGLFVVLTIGLRQKGSSESKQLEGEDDCDEDPREHRHDPDVPWPVRRGGAWLWLYERSLSIALFAIFALSFVLHAWGGHVEANTEHALRHEPHESFWSFAASADFWFQSLQNWQSEFVSVLAIVVLSIFLRQRGSSQSKRVAAPHGETGE